MIFFGVDFILKLQSDMINHHHQVFSYKGFYLYI